MSALDDLLDNLFNPFQKGALENPYAPPPSGTPSLTDPGTYTPTTPGSGPQPYNPYTPPDPIDDPYDDDDDDDNTPYTPPGPPGPGPGDDDDDDDDDDDTPTGPPGSSGPPGGNNPYDQYGGYARPAQLGGYDAFGHGKRGAVLTGHALSPPMTMSLDDFVNNVLPKAAGNYGKGMHYDPETGSVWSNISPEKLQELSDKGVAMQNVNTAYLTDFQLYKNYLHGHNPGAVTGSSMVRMGGDTGQYYFIDPNNPNQIIYYNYKQTMDGQPSFAGPGQDGGPPPSNILETPGQVGDPYADDLTQEQRAMMPALRNKMEEEQAAADALAAQQQEETATGAELLMELEVSPQESPQPDLTPVVDPKETEPPPSAAPPGITGLPDLQAGSDLFNQIMGSFGGGQGQNMLSPYGGFDFNMPLTMEEPVPEMTPPLMQPPPPTVPDFGAGLQMGPSTPMPTGTPPIAPPTPPIPMPPGLDLGPATPMPGPQMPGTPPPIAPPTPPIPEMGPIPGPMAPPPPTPVEPPKPTAPPPPPTDPLAGLTPQEIADIRRAAEDLLGGGMALNFNQGGPVQSGVGSLFRREVMR